MTTPATHSDAIRQFQANIQAIADAAPKQPDGSRSTDTTLHATPKIMGAVLAFLDNAKDIAKAAGETDLTKQDDLIEFVDVCRVTAEGVNIDPKGTLAGTLGGYQETDLSPT